MTDKKFFAIGEVAELLNISPATLRYWQKNGIFEVARGGNGYRKYSIEDLVNIAEISFYRNLGIPVKEMADFRNFDREDYRKKLEILEVTLREKMLTYHKAKSLVRMKQSHIAKIKCLKEKTFIEEGVPFDCVVKFDFNDKEKLVNYARNPSRYVRVIDSENLKLDVRGMVCRTAQIRSDDVILWRKKTGNRYLSFLISEYPDCGYANNIAEYILRIKKRFNTGKILAMFLLTERKKGQSIDYLQGFVEIEE